LRAGHELPHFAGVYTSVLTSESSADFPQVSQNRAPSLVDPEKVMIQIVSHAIARPIGAGMS
jgi:hypothetical protein